MGSEYGLELSTDLKPKQVLCLLADRLELKWVDGKSLRGPALWIDSREVTGIRCDIIKEGFHFRPDVLVVFRLNPNSDEYEEGNRLMLRATMALLEQSRDGVLLFNGEHIVLQRIGGQLMLNADYGGWTDGFCLENEVWLSHETRSLPSPLL